MVMLTTPPPNWLFGVTNPLPPIVTTSGPRSPTTYDEPAVTGPPDARAPIPPIASPVGVNRTGSDPTLRYNGQSLVIDPLGEIVADAGETEGAMKVALSSATVADWRKRFPALKDRKKDSVLLIPNH